MWSSTATTPHASLSAPCKADWVALWVSVLLVSDESFWNSQIFIRLYIYSNTTIPGHPPWTLQKWHFMGIVQVITSTTKNPTVKLCCRCLFVIWLKFWNSHDTCLRRLPRQCYGHTYCVVTFAIFIITTSHGTQLLDTFYFLSLPSFITKRQNHCINYLAAVV